MGNLLYSVFITIAFASISFCQVGINTTVPNAMLDITSSSVATPSANDGILIPRINEFPVTNPTIAQNGMLVYATGNGGVSEGFYYWDWDGASGSWVSLSSLGVEKIDDLEDAKSDNDGTNNGSSLFLGENAGATDDLSDNRNVGVGFSSLTATTTGYRNTALGYNTLKSNTTATNNVAIGYAALEDNTTGNTNVGVGSYALSTNTTGVLNTSVGYNSLKRNTKGGRNVALGGNALQNNTEGDHNIALGFESLKGNTLGEYNVGIGSYALGVNSLGDYNSSLGYQSMFNNATGTANVAMGYRALYRNVSGINNVAIGNSSGYSSLGNSNVFIGYSAGYNFTGNERLFIENTNADKTAALIYGEFDNNTLRFNDRVGIGMDPTSIIGLPMALSVDGRISASTSVIYINSDKRLKKEVKTIKSQLALDKLKQLDGVTFKWNDTVTNFSRPKGIQYGFTAQNIKQVFPENVFKDNKGYYMTSYGAYDAFFVQAIKELDSKIRLLEAENKELKIHLANYKNIEERLSILERKK